KTVISPFRQSYQRGSPGCRPKYDIYCRILRIAGSPVKRGMRHGRLGVASGMIGAAHERPGLDVPEAEAERLVPQRSELVGVVVARHRQVQQGRAQVLTDGQNLDALVRQPGEDRAQLIRALAQADHQTSLHQWPCRRAAPTDGLLEEADGPLET